MTGIGNKDGEYWRQRGYECVMRYGSLVERMKAQNNLTELTKIREMAHLVMIAPRSEAA